MAMSLLQTKNRIKSVASTKKITKAMELVATSKLKKAKDINSSITPYKQEVFEIISYCAKNVTENDYKYFNENKKANKNLNIVITSTLGLCGGYNIAIEKYVMNNVSKDDDLIVLGAKGINYFKDKGYNILQRYSELPPLNLKESLSATLSNITLKEFDKGNYKRINIIYTKFINSLTLLLP